MDGIWRQSCRAEFGGSTGMTNLALMWDIKKCYEFVNDFKLGTAALSNGYPLATLRLSVAS